MTLKHKLYASAAIIALSTSSALATSETETTTGTQLAASSEMAEGSFAPGWNEELDNRYADIAELPVRELVGMNVLTDNGEDVGEIDDFVILDGSIQAVVGVGGFLGLGEHDVALSLDDLDWDGENMVVSFTREELEAMPEWTEEIDYTAFQDGDTFRTRTMDPNTAATPMTETSEDVAEAGSDAASAIEEGTESAAQMAENAADATVEAAENAGESVADAASAAGEAIQDSAESAQQMAAAGMANAAEWLDKLDGEYAEIADRPVTELEGVEVASADGNVIGEVDDIAMKDGEPVAIVGIGGFLGVAEHDVALTLENLGWDGEHFVARGYTEAELKEMPEYDAAAVQSLPNDASLRSHIETVKTDS